MPSQDGVRRDDRRELHQCLPTDGFRFYSQSLFVSEQNPFLSQFLYQRLDLGVLKLDGFLLAFVDPATKDGEQHLPGLEERIHGSPKVESGCLISFRVFW